MEVLLPVATSVPTEPNPNSNLPQKNGFEFEFEIEHFAGFGFGSVFGSKFMNMFGFEELSRVILSTNQNQFYCVSKIYIFTDHKVVNYDT